MPLLTFEEARRRVGTPGISALLAAAGGFLDGFTYVGHGHVFANAMTGNVVLLGINCLSGSWHSAFHHLPAILAFLVGICVSDAMQLHPKRRGVSAPYIAVLVLEIGILTGLSLLPAKTADIFFTTSIAFAASVQVRGLFQVTLVRTRHEMPANRSLARSGLFLISLCASDPIRGGKQSRNLSAGEDGH